MLRTRRRFAALATLGGLLLCGIGCSVSPDERASQILNQRGFGRKFVGDSNEQYYLGISDAIAIMDPLNPELAGQYVIGPDGTINIPFVGEVFVAGMTISEVTELLNERFRTIIETANVYVQVLRVQSKRFYVQGEAGRVGALPFTGDTTLFDVIIQAAPRNTANLHKVRLIRADPVHPFVMEFDYKDMLQRGYSGPNVLVRENDIIYIPPNLLGQLSNLLLTLLSPLTSIVSSAVALNNLVVVTETFSDSDRFINTGFGGRGVGGFSRRGGGVRF